MLLLICFVVCPDGKYDVPVPLADLEGLLGRQGLHVVVVRYAELHPGLAATRSGSLGQMNAAGVRDSRSGHYQVSK